MHTRTDPVLHDAFMNRQKVLFDTLLTVERECNKNKMVTESSANLWTDAESDSSVDRTQRPRGQKRKSETKRFRGKESIFKRPEGPAPRSSVGGIPDYHRNPHKWTKYSLEDVRNEDMTERSNAQAALSFLKELRARKERERENEEDKMDVEENETDERANVAFKSRKMKSFAKIQFKKPESEKTEDSAIVVDSDEKPTFRNSKVIMPEYVVGQKQKRKSKDKVKVKVDRSKELRLDHLHESDEEQGDEN